MQDSSDDADCALPLLLQQSHQPPPPQQQQFPSQFQTRLSAANVSFPHPNNNSNNNFSIFDNNTSSAANHTIIAPLDVAPTTSSSAAASSGPLVVADQLISRMRNPNQSEHQRQQMFLEAHKMVADLNRRIDTCPVVARPTSIGHKTAAIFSSVGSPSPFHQSAALQKDDFTALFALQLVSPEVFGIRARSAVAFVRSSAGENAALRLEYFFATGDFVDGLEDRETLVEATTMPQQQQQPVDLAKMTSMLKPNIEKCKEGCRKRVDGRLAEAKKENSGSESTVETQDELLAQIRAKVQLEIQIEKLLESSSKERKKI